MQLKNATILLVDDEPDWRSIMSEWFGREGCHVLLAEHGAEALKLIHANHVDVVVSDVRMPVMDGITLLKSIKAEEGYKPSVMFMSGFSDIGPGEAYDLGVEAMMAKPVERKHLVAAVTRVLAARDDLWRLARGDQPATLLDAVFSSLAAALSQGLLAFGRGGFRIHSRLNLREGPVELHLDFTDDKRKVTGQGIIRWIAPSEAEIGVEITHIDDKNRAWIIGLTGANASLSFIPRTTSVATAQIINAVK
jgi:CheY-like chemotaxis protein